MKLIIHSLAPRPPWLAILQIATTRQFFQFNGDLFEQIDNVTMGSPLGPLLTNVLCAPMIVN